MAWGGRISGLAGLQPWGGGVSYGEPGPARPSLGHSGGRHASECEGNPLAKRLGTAPGRAFGQSRALPGAPPRCAQGPGVRSQAAAGSREPK